MRALANDAEATWVEPTPADIAKHEDLYEITYKEATRTLDDQSAEVNNARTRAVQYLAFVGSATAFLLGTAVKDITQRDGTFYVIATAGSSLALLGLVCIAALLNPWQTPLYKRVEPKLLLVNFIERQVPIPNKAEMFRELSIHFENWQSANQRRLKSVRILYFASILLGSLQLLLWATLTWLAG
ncbi:hypothetical protein [Geodermatophilus obscurus]|uniref:hypothetical protein n=1 Tax=Geodermatophilus obscurus TaxID=1861 RepID=UPI0009433482|nr:hypothetical protein [Geodermatophilus obscurus]